MPTELARVRVMGEGHLREVPSTLSGFGPIKRAQNLVSRFNAMLKRWFQISSVYTYVSLDPFNISKPEVCDRYNEKDQMKFPKYDGQVRLVKAAHSATESFSMPHRTFHSILSARNVERKKQKSE